MLDRQEEIVQEQALWQIVRETRASLETAICEAGDYGFVPAVLVLKLNAYRRAIREAVHLETIHAKET